MKHLDLFSGIGGFALAARNVGWETVGFCEIEPFAQRVLRKHWDVPIYEDVRDVTAERLRADGLDVDVITGGFPCQDISFAGKGAGIEGERSGLWKELARIIGELRPRYAVMENVAALLGRGLDVVLGDLAEIGYDAEWHCIPASSVGAPHRRDRIWIVAYPNDQRGLQGSADVSEADGEIPKRNNDAESWDTGSRTNVAYPNELGKGNGGRRRTLRDEQQNGQAKEQGRNVEQYGADGNGEDVAHADNQGLEGNGEGRLLPKRETTNGHPGQGGEPEDGTEGRTESGLGLLAHGLSAGLARPGWLPEPGIGRIASGVPDRTHKLKGLGNAIVPQVAEVIFRAINEVEK